MTPSFEPQQGEDSPSASPSDEVLLLVAAETLPFLAGGLNAESASRAALAILRNTDFEAVAITSERSLLAFAGHDREGALEAVGKEMGEALRTGTLQFMDRPGDFLSADATLQRGLIAPIRVGGDVIGSLILGFSGPTEDRRPKQTLASALARLLGAQIELGTRSSRDTTSATEADQYSLSPYVSAIVDSLISLCQGQPEAARRFLKNSTQILRDALPYEKLAQQWAAELVGNPTSAEEHAPAALRVPRSAHDNELSPQQELGRLPVEKSGRTVLLDVDSIVFARARSGHFFVNTHDESFHIRFSLRELEKRISSPFFFRCHRSFLINLRQVDEVLPMFNGTYLLYVRDIRKSEIPVSRQQARQLRHLLGV